MICCIYFVNSPVDSTVPIQLLRLSVPKVLIARHVLPNQQIAPLVLIAMK